MVGDIKLLLVPRSQVSNQDRYCDSAQCLPAPLEGKYYVLAAVHGFLLLLSFGIELDTLRVCSARPLWQTAGL